VGVIQALLNGHRAGVAVQRLMRFFAEVNTELTALQDTRARAGGGPIDDHERARRGHLWMLRQDLAGYVLLGDPAVRLPIADGADGTGGTEASNAGRTAGEHAAAVTRAEAAVLAVLRGDPVAAAAGRHGLDRAELERLVASYRAAGRDALEAACRRDRGL
jgi:hypothetical protein